MTLKAATVLAIVGASIQVALGVLNMAAGFILSLQELLWYGAVGIMFKLLSVIPSVSYLMFFITLRSKQNQ